MIRLLQTLLCAMACVARARGDGDPVPRDPLELRALVEPTATLAAIPAELDKAHAAGDQRRVALLQIARANACRIVADWACQRDAGIDAQAAARSANEPALVVRGLIAESRGRISLNEFARGEQLLGEAETVLREYPLPDLLADVHLGYSSLYYVLGKQVDAADYADRGLAALGTREVPLVRVRLLRNKARALVMLGEWDKAEQALAIARPYVADMHDPKLDGELELESARIADARGDIAGMRQRGARILELAATLDNAQLRGQGHEVLGRAARAGGDARAAEREWREAAQAFRQTGQAREELNVLGALLHLPPGPHASVADFQAPLTRYLELLSQVEQNERHRVAAELDTRLAYAQQQLVLARLQGEAALAGQRESALNERQQLTGFLALLGGLLALILAVNFWNQRRSNRRLQQALEKLGESEARYRVLAENSRDLVVRMRPDGTRLYISPSVQEMLGYAPEELLEPRWELVHIDDRMRLVAVVQGLRERGDTAQVSYRIQRKDGGYAWLEALAQRVASPSGDGSDEIVYTARDISERVRAEHALERSEARLRAIADNIPALVAHVDAQERYDYINAWGLRHFGLPADAVLGRTILEARGEAMQRQVQPHVAAALRGQRSDFEVVAHSDGREMYFDTSFVPDLAADGSCRGFFVLGSDITWRKRAERELDRLARIDSLTGIANRRQFEESFAAAIARAQRHARPLALLYLDIDRFKSINDSLGHQSGDAVIREFAARLQRCLRQEDLVARLGGDEFVVVLEETAQPDDAAGVACKIVEAMRVPVRLGQDTLAFSTSVGVAFARAPRDPDALTALADRALYAAKAAGRDGWVLLEFAVAEGRLSARQH